MMAHYPGHKRGAFSDWVAAGMPEEAQMEVNYEHETWPADEFLRDFLGCTDVVPKDLRRDLELATGLDEERLMTYAHAAHELLLFRREGFALAHKYQLEEETELEKEEDHEHERDVLEMERAEADAEAEEREEGR
jgi:hypothetical protein